MRFPAMEALRSDYTEVWISRPVVPLVLFADRVRALADTGIDRIGLPGIDVPPLREFEGFDRIVSWYGSAREEFRAAVHGLPFTFHPALASAPPVSIPRIALRGPRHGAVIAHPYSGSARKNYPGFADLAREVPVVRWTCGPEEDWPGAVRFDCLGELARWISGASLFIGNDSGITHLAAALGVRTIALFGPTDPAIWCPPGEHVTALSFDEANFGITASLQARAAFLSRPLRLPARR
ncbi:MAG: glycosyltransferase family 9 protein [Acidobacteria bacterium]|nr:glycosyltransferase family 9 protein [Acidobacteriota bacterium]